MMKDLVAFAGDWHGDVEWAKRCITKTAETHQRALFHLGDFGIWPGPSGAAYLRKVQAHAASCGVTLFVTPGNHENWDRLNRLPRTVNPDWPQMGEVAWVSPNIAVFPRGHRFTHRDRTWLSVGGAPSIDRDFRTAGKSWWPDEVLSEPETDRIVAETSAAGVVDVMLTHDSPNEPYMVSAVHDIVHGPKPHWVSDDVVAYLADGRRRLHRIVEVAQPELLVHGHYHTAGNGVTPYPGTGRCAVVISIPEERHRNNLRFLVLP